MKALRQILPFVLALLAVIAVIFAVAFLASKNLPGASEEGSHATSTQEGEGGNGALDTTPGYSIEEVPLDGIRDLMPNLSRTIAFNANVPAEARTIITNKAVALSAKLNSDPTQIANWLDLAVQYHQAGDYQGAREIWEFLVKVAPNELTPYDNLGRLYRLDLKNYPKAEEYFRKSIAVKASVVAYMELYELYKYSYKTGTNTVIDLLKEASAKFPQNPDFSALLGLEYRDRGDKENARLWLQKGVDIARAIGQSAYAAQLEEEIIKLR